MGNIRVTVNDIDSIVTKDDYYPFGLQMPDMSFNNGNTNDRLKYSGKELDEEGGLHKYHFGWSKQCEDPDLSGRDYDPEIARWYVVDPKAIDYPSLSPYNYVLNNPLGLIDPNGMQPTNDSFDDNQSADSGLYNVIITNWFNDSIGNIILSAKQAVKSLPEFVADGTVNTAKATVKTAKGVAKNTVK